MIHHQWYHIEVLVEDDADVIMMNENTPYPFNHQAVYDQLLYWLTLVIGTILPLTC